MNDAGEKLKIESREHLRAEVVNAILDSPNPDAALERLVSADFSALVGGGEPKPNLYCLVCAYEKPKAIISPRGEFVCDDCRRRIQHSIWEHFDKSAEQRPGLFTVYVRAFIAAADYATALTVAEMVMIRNAYPRVVDGCTLSAQWGGEGPGAPGAA